MTLVVQTAESGLASGTAVTAANSAHNDAYSVDPTKGTGSTVNYSSLHAVNGSLSILCKAGASAAAYCTWTNITGNTNQAAVSMEIYLDALPNATKGIIALRSPSGGTGLLTVAIDSAGHMKILSDADGTQTATSTGTLSITTAYRVEVVLSNGTSTTGAAEVRVYASGSTTAISTLGVSMSASNFGTNTIGCCRHGWTTSGGTNTPGIYIDNIQFQTGSNSFIGPYVVNTAPTAAFTHSETGLATTVDASTSAVTTAGATITSYAWDFGDSGTATGVTPAAHTYAAAGSYTVTLTITDSNGLTDTATATVTVTANVPSGTVASVDVSTGWTANTGTVLSCITDDDTTTLITSSASPTDLELMVTLEGAEPPLAGEPFRVPIGIDRIGSTSGSFDADLIAPDGTTVLSTISNTAIPAGSGTSVDTVTVLSFPSTDLPASGSADWDSLKVKLLVTAS